MHLTVESAEDYVFERIIVYMYIPKRFYVLCVLDGRATPDSAIQSFRPVFSAEHDRMNVGDFTTAFMITRFADWMSQEKLVGTPEEIWTLEVDLEPFNAHLPHMSRSASVLHSTYIRASACGLHIQTPYEHAKSA